MRPTAREISPSPGRWIKSPKREQTAALKARLPLLIILSLIINKKKNHCSSLSPGFPGLFYWPIAKIY